MFAKSELSNICYNKYLAEPFLFDKKGILWLVRIAFMWYFFMWQQETCQGATYYREEEGKP